MKSNAIKLRQQVEHRHEAEQLLTEAGETVLVYRGVARSLAMACPDGCGEQLTINVDPRAGKAWRYYLKAGRLSVFPSVWRTTGCKSHFIVWQSRIYWCDEGEDFEDATDALIGQVQQQLSERWDAFADVAERLGEVPWAVLSALRALKRMGKAREGSGDLAGYFRKGS